MINFTSETAWNETGGGLSAYESIPSFQSSVSGVVGSYRGTPDISMVADPTTGVSVYIYGQWAVVGGTSLSSPVAAGLLNLAAANAGSFSDQATTFQTLYSNGAASIKSRDVTLGSCGGNSSATGYDLCTGWGSLLSYPALAGQRECLVTGTKNIMGGASVSKFCPTVFSSSMNGAQLGNTSVNGQGSYDHRSMSAYTNK